MRKIKNFQLLTSILLIISLLTSCREIKNPNKEELVADDNLTSEDKLESPKNTSPSIIRLGSLKGPTTIGALDMIENSKTGKLDFIVEENITGAGDELVAMISKGQIDLAILPLNLAANIYNKTGEIQVLASNNLGVLYIISSEDINNFNDLEGKKILSTGKGTTPDIIFTYLAKANGLSQEDYDLEFYSEASEVASKLISGQETTALLPEPMASNVLEKSEQFQRVLDFNKEWRSFNLESDIVTSVLIGNKDFLSNNKDLIKPILKAYESSINSTSENPEKIAKFSSMYGIIEEDVALKAMDNLNMFYTDGNDMILLISSYLEIINQENPDFIGGRVPDSGFYYDE